MDTFRKIARVAIPVTLVVVPLLTLAVVLPQPTVPVGGTGTNLAELEQIIRQVARFLIIISIVIAVVFIILGAIFWMSSAGDDKRAEKGKAWIKNGLYGAAIVFAIGVILQTIAGVVARTFFS